MYYNYNENKVRIFFAMFYLTFPNSAIYLCLEMQQWEARKPLRAGRSKGKLLELGLLPPRILKTPFYFDV